MTSRKERKVVTVLFVDLVGFTARAEQLDPEDVEAILEPYHARVRAELERHGGTVEKFIGDAVMALFGAPVAHEDDPERAVRAALAIREAALEDEFEVRIAVNTGEALVSVDARPEAGEKMAAGDVVNTTARLQAAAPVNGILVGEATERATRHAVVYRDHAPVDAKGKAEPVRVSEAVEARSRFGVDVRQHGGASLVGRARELDVLTGALARVRSEREPQLVTIVGVPGIGKSRLVWELFQVVDADPELIRWRQGRCLPYGEGISFWALGEMVKAHAGILETDSPDDVQRKLAEIGDDGHLRPLVGLSADVVDRVEAFAAWRSFLEGIAEEGPLVLVFEDLHWADEGLLDFVDHLADWARGVSLLTVCSARPELLDRRPGWGGGKLNAQTLALSPLPDAEAARLIGELLGQTLLPAETQSDLLERAGGNPLYAEQYALLFRECGTVEGLPLPETVQGIVAARLDGLSPEEKRVLQDAAVIGKVFWTGALGVDGPDEVLHGLERKEFVRRERRSSVEGQEEYSFRHALVRDVAYAQIPRAERGDRHLAVAAWLESLGRPEDHAELLAHHYLAALEYGRPHERAAAAFRAAGDRAFSLNSFDAAATHYQRVLDASPEEADPRFLYRFGFALFSAFESGVDELSRAVDSALSRGDHETAVEAQLQLVMHAWLKGDRELTDARLARAEELAARLSASRAKAHALAMVTRHRMLAGRHQEAIHVGEQALVMAREQAADDLRMNVLTSLGPSLAATGDYDGGCAALEEAIELGKELGHPDVTRSYNNLASVVAQHGDLRRCSQLHQEAVELGERFGHGAWLRWLRGELASDAYFLGDWDLAVATADRFEEEAAAGDPHYLLHALHTYRSLVRIARGDVDGALSDAARALDQGREARDPQALQPGLSCSVYLNALLGRHQEARELLDEMLADIRLTRYAYEPELVWSALRLGRGDELRQALERNPESRWRAASLALFRGDLLEAAELYDLGGFLPGEALLRGWAAERLLADGRRNDAEEQLGKALAFWRSVGATRYIAEAEALRAQAATA